MARLRARFAAQARFPGPRTGRRKVKCDPTTMYYSTRETLWCRSRPAPFASCPRKRHFSMLNRVKTAGTQRRAGTRHRHPVLMIDPVHPGASADFCQNPPARSKTMASKAKGFFLFFIKNRHRRSPLASGKLANDSNVLQP